MHSVAAPSNKALKLTKHGPCLVGGPALGLTANA